MAAPTSPGKVDVKIVSENGETSAGRSDDIPFRIALLGDFSGRGSRGVGQAGGNVSASRIHRIDRDNFSEVLSRLQVEIRIAILAQKSPPVALRFAQLDDFHPDRLFENADIFDPLKETRQSLKDPAVIAAIANQLSPAANPTEPSVAPSESHPAGNLLDQVLDASEGALPMQASRPPSDLDDFVKQTVKPYSVPMTHPAQARLLAKVDEAIGELMRKMLRHPDFQALEAAWRGLHFLVSQIETDEDLKLYLIDISKDELAADLEDGDDIAATRIYELLCKETPRTGDVEPWSLLAGNFVFDRTPEDAALLGRLARLAEVAGAPFISAAHPRLLGCDSLVETTDPDDWRSAFDDQTRRAWNALRKLPEAGYIGLALPRFLLRLPYGKETEPIERFDFDEFESVPKHEEYLWGNPTYACVYLIAQAFSEHGWDFHPGMIQEIGGLPLHVYKNQGESRAKPCAEVILTQRATEAILDRGLMPLLSFVNHDYARLVRFQSVADPPTPLLGRWR